MKCPKCNLRFPMHGNSKGKMGVPVLECPDCRTTFELHSMQKMFPKGILVTFLVLIPLSFLPPIAAVVLIVLYSIPLQKWIFRPENIVIREESEKNT